jgi:hypothetical protein
VFVLAQWLSSALLFVPGSQAFRTPIRALPYLIGLALLFLHAGTRGFRGAQPRWTKLLALALVLLVLELLHPMTNLAGGIAQCLLQLSIAASVFWVPTVVRTGARLNRLVWVFFLAAALNSAVGALQVYYPETFMPAEFSSLALALNPEAISSLTYVGADGREIVRPPGLSDYPGGASVAGMMTGLLGIVLAAQRGLRRWLRVLCVALATIGLATLYLTQVRSLVMMMLASVAIMCALLLRQRRVAESAVVAIVGAALLVGAFLWATAVGGESVSSRFLDLIEESPVASFQQNRGGFIETTVRELLAEYPLGAGLGRWGMMYVHFGQGGSSDPIHVEIQMTGWLLDGGVLMWLFYGGAILFALRFLYSVSVRSQDPDFAYLAGLIFTICFIVVGQSMAGPSFNTVLGMQFWLLVSAVYGVARERVALRRAGDEPTASIAPMERLAVLR